MRLTVLILSLILSIACSKDINNEFEDSPEPVVAISPPIEEKDTKAESVPLPENLVNGFPKPEIEERDEELELKKGLKTLARQSGLRSLETAKFQNSDIEPVCN